ncbi:MAG: helix-turn-helix domain-containing protein [Candidatus Gracilibacteria bacterium]|jgi:hypothetical protein
MQFKFHLLSLLQRIGLTSGEAHFYLTIHQNPGFSIKELQKKTGFSLASTYRAFEHLKTLGLVSSSSQSWKQTVHAVSLHGLADRLGREQRRLRKVELELKRLGNLMNLTSHSALENPVEIFTEKADISNQAFAILSRWDHFLAYGSAERLIDVLGDKEEHAFVQIRRKKGVPCNAIMTEYGNYSREIFPNNERDLRNARLHLDSTYNDSMVYLHDKEALVWHRDAEFGNRAILIREPSIFKLHECLFRTLWEKGVATPREALKL